MASTPLKPELQAMKTIVLASANPGKLKEFNQLFQNLATRFVSQAEFNIADVDETAATFLENALIKARHAAHYTKLPALSDDSGLCVPALEGQPGIYSARFSGIKNDEQNNAKLLQKMACLTGYARRACFCATLVLVEHEADPMPLVFQGVWWGEILTEPRGKNGFGYDSLFYIPSLGQTAAELMPELKNQLSHRGQAVTQLLTYWQNLPPVV